MLNLILMISLSHMTLISFYQCLCNIIFINFMIQFMIFVIEILLDRLEEVVQLEKLTVI